MTMPLASETVYAVGEACRRRLGADAGRAWHGYSVVGAANLAELLDADDIDLPAVALVDFAAHAAETAVSIARIHRRWPELGIVVRVANDSRARAVDAIQAGAVDAVAMTCDERQLAQTVRSAIDRSRSLLAQRADTRDAEHRLASLSPREREVLNLVAAGCETAEVARRLRVSPRTIERHRSHILRKTGARNVVQLADAVRRAGMQVDPPPATPYADLANVIDDVRLPVMA